MRRTLSYYLLKIKEFCKPYDSKIFYLNSIKANKAAFQAPYLVRSKTILLTKRLGSLFMSGNQIEDGTGYSQTTAFLNDTHLSRFSLSSHSGSTSAIYHTAASSIQQPKHPQRHLLPIANLDVVGSYVRFFNPSDLLVAFICAPYLHSNPTVNTKITPLGVLDGVVERGRSG